MVHRSHLCALTLGLIGLFIVGCQTEPRSESGRKDLLDNAQNALKTMKHTDPSLDHFLGKSYGYVIFPEVGKGGFIAGGAYGRGVVYEQGNWIGYADISQATIGLQAGGQTFRELIVFESKADLDRFTAGKLAFAANVSAVVLKSGAGDSARYTDGVAVFAEPIGGLMAEASIGGQQFTFRPK